MDRYKLGCAVLLSLGALHHAFNRDQTILNLPRSEGRRRNPDGLGKRAGAMHDDLRIKNNRGKFRVTENTRDGDSLTGRVPFSVAAYTHSHAACGVLYK